jgi:hypothetical protein
MSELTIEVEAFWGDNDTHNEMWMVGPFPSEQTRELAWKQLKGLPGNHGDALFSYCHKPMAAADNAIDLSVDPDRLSRVACFHELLEAFE